MKRLVWVVMVVILLNGCSKDPPAPSSSSSSLLSESSSSEEIHYYDDYHMLARDYFTALRDIFFEEGQAMMIDRLMLYYQLFEMYDDNWNLPEYLQQYQTGNPFNEIRIPKEIVNDYFTKHFAVRLDDTQSEFYPDDSTDFYLLEVSGVDGAGVDILNKSIDGNRIIIDGGILRDIYGVESYDQPYSTKFRMCIENYDNEDFKYIYCRQLPL